MAQLVLGTAQLGLKYGVNNTAGKLSQQQVYEILDAAYDNGIDILDTALSYGDSEKIIGTYMKEKNKHFKICTKLPSIIKTTDKLNIIKYNMKKSLQNLELPYIDFYLFHNFNDLLDIYNELEYLNKLKSENIIRKLGVSIYDIEELEYIVNYAHDYIDLIQIPFNIFDLRWLENNLLLKAKEKGIEIAVRSVLLQGLFFVNKDTAHKVHPKAYDYIVKLKELSDYKGITLQQLAISFVKCYSFISYILIGCESKEQLFSNVNDFNIDIDFSQEDLEFINRNFGDIEKKIIDPRQW